jgi:hypothetical protein
MIDAFHEGLSGRHGALLRFIAEGHERDLTLGQLFEEGAAVATELTQVQKFRLRQEITAAMKDGLRDFG